MADELADQGSVGTQRPVGHGDGGMPGSSLVQNQQVDDAVREVESRLGRALSTAEGDQVHDLVHGQNLDYRGMVDRLQEEFWRPGDSPL